MPPMPNILNTIGQNIKRLRTASGMSQEAVAERSGMHRTYIGGIERGERNVSALNLEKIAKVLDVAPDELLKQTSDERNGK